MSTVEIHYQLTGPADAPVLVLAEPLGATLELWKPHVEALTGRYRLLRYDHRGHGRSPVPPGPYAIADLAGDLLALLDRLGIEQVDFCGLSLGGMVGIWLGAHAPQRLSTLTLCCTTAGFGDPAQWHERAATVRASGTAALAPSVVARWFTPDWAAQHPEVVERVRQMIFSSPDEGYAACCEAIADWDGYELLARISAPTLVIAGACDPGTPPAPHAETLTAGIPGAKLEIVDSAHLAPVEQAEQVTELLMEHAANR